MVNALEKLHQAGFVHNDIKLDNLLLEHDVNKIKLSLTSENFFLTNDVKLIDLGYATTYLEEETGQHTRKQKVNVFRGNAYFSSLN